MGGEGECQHFSRVGINQRVEWRQRGWEEWGSTRRGVGSFRFCLPWVGFIAKVARVLVWVVGGLVFGVTKLAKPKEERYLFLGEIGRSRGYVVGGIIQHL